MIDWNIVIGVITIVLTIIGFFLASGKTLKSKTKMKSNSSSNFNIQDGHNDLTQTNIGTQINNPAPQTIRNSSFSYVIPESIGLFNQHICTNCHKGYKVLGSTQPSIIVHKMLTCPYTDCGNVDKI